MNCQISSAVNEMIRCGKSCHRTDDAVHCRLSCAAENRSLLLAVKSVLDDVKIEVGHIYYAEVMESVECDMEIEIVIALLHSVDEVIQLHERPLVKLCELIVGNAVLIGIEACTVA